MRLPRSFNEITVKQYQDIYFLIQENPEDDFLYAENWARVISILSGEDYEKILCLPRVQFKNLIKRLDFILRPEVLQERVKQYISVKGWIYKTVTNGSQLSTSQVISIKGFQSLDKNLNEVENTVVNMHNLLATIYLPLSFRGFKYNSSKHNKIAQRMLHAKMGDVYGTLFFYPILYDALIKATPAFTEDHLSVLTEHFQEIEQTLGKNLKKDGAGK